MSTFYFARRVGDRQPLKPSETTDYFTDRENAVELAENLNKAEGMRMQIGFIPKARFEAVRIEVTPLPVRRKSRL